MIRKKQLCAVAGAFALLASSGQIYAQSQTSQPQARSAANAVTWTDEAIRGGISVNRLIGLEVRGRNGKEIGNVDQVLVSDQGRVSGIVVQSGGFMNIGDTRFRIPWQDVQLGVGMEHVLVPLTEQTAERYRDRTDDTVKTRAREFRVSRIKDGEVTLRDGTRYGEVEDLIMTRGGELHAVIVDASFGPGGRRAIPYDAATFNFDGNTYRAPFERNQAGNYRPFDYAQYGVAEPRGTATGATGGAGAGGTREGPGTRAPRQSRG